MIGKTSEFRNFRFSVKSRLIIISYDYFIFFAHLDLHLIQIPLLLSFSQLFLHCFFNISFKTFNFSIILLFSQLFQLAFELSNVFACSFSKRICVLFRFSLRIRSNRNIYPSLNLDTSSKCL